MSKYPPWTKFKDCNCHLCERHRKLWKIIEGLKDLKDKKFLEDFEYELESAECAVSLLKKEIENKSELMEIRK